MDGYGHVRCLFCESGKEGSVVNAIHAKQWGRAIFAQRVKMVWRQRDWVETTAPLLPGYVFVYADEEDERYARYAEIEHVIHVLKYQDGTETLIGHDLEFADWLWRIGGKVGVMKALEKGDRVEIIDGVFKALHGTIVRMNRRRKKMCVSIEMQGNPIQIWLSYELAERADEGRPNENDSRGTEK